MNLLKNLERKFGRYIPEGLTKILLAGQVVSFIIIYSRPDFAPYFYLTGNQVLSGEIWRLALVLFTPLSGNFIFIALAWYFFYFFSTALESRWGSFRYLTYVAVGYLAAIIFTFIFPQIVISNVYIYTTLFLAFAHLYPEVRVLLFFIIPVKMKWLGIFAWLGLLVSFVFGPVAEKVLILLSISNFILFFYNDLRYGLSSASKGTPSAPRLIKQKPLHICAVCGQNEIDNPDMEIRYCNICKPTTCYCGNHALRHQHKRIVN